MKGCEGCKGRQNQFFGPHYLLVQKVQIRLITSFHPSHQTSQLLCPFTLCASLCPLSPLAPAFAPFYPLYQPSYPFSLHTSFCTLCISLHIFTFAPFVPAFKPFAPVSTYFIFASPFSKCLHSFCTLLPIAPVFSPFVPPFTPLSPFVPAFAPLIHRCYVFEVLIANDAVYQIHHYLYCTTSGVQRLV